MFKIGDKTVSVNGENVGIEVPAKIVNGRTFVPLRFISEKLNYYVLWDGENWTIDILENDYILRTSNTEELSGYDLNKLTDKALTLAKNEIFARHRHDFDTDWIKKYFESREWYKPIKELKVNVNDLSALEQKNIEIINLYINRLTQEEAKEIYKNSYKIDDLYEKNAEFTVTYSDGTKANLTEKVFNRDLIEISGKYELIKEIDCDIKIVKKDNDSDTYYCLYINDSHIGLDLNVLTGIAVIDIDKRDNYKEIAIFGYGPSDHSMIILYRYVNGEIVCVGDIGEGNYLYDSVLINQEGILFDPTSVIPFTDELAIIYYIKIVDNEAFLIWCDEISNLTSTINCDFEAGFIDEEFFHNGIGLTSEECKIYLKKGEKITILQVIDDYPEYKVILPDGRVGYMTIRLAG